MSRKSIIPIALVIAAIGIIAMYYVSINSQPQNQTISDKPAEVMVDDNLSGEPQVQKPADDGESSIINLDAGENTIKNTLPALPTIKLVEGVDYVTKFPDEQPKEPLLMEFFSYMCVHCFNFEAIMKRWQQQKPESVQLILIPVSFGRSDAWGLTARAHYIAEELNVMESFSQAMFRKIHIEKKPPQNETDIAQLFLSLGVNNITFNKTAHSFSVDVKLNKAELLTKKYKVSGVPYFLINNKYETGSRSFESEHALFLLWNNLPGKDFLNSQ